MPRQQSFQRTIPSGYSYFPDMSIERARALFRRYLEQQQDLGIRNFVGLKTAPLVAEANVSRQALEATNHLTDPDLIIAGQRLIIPAPEPASGIPANLLNDLEVAQRRQSRALKTVLELLIEKGLFSREEFVASVNKRSDT